MLTWVVIGLWSAGCDSRSLPLDEDAGPALDSKIRSDQIVRRADLSAPQQDGGEQNLRACMVAIQLKECCPQPKPALKQHVEQDPCLIPYPIDGDIPTNCVSSGPCPDIACMAKPPRSRLVEAFPGGGCIWKDECETAQDCGMARDVRVCCSCFVGFPQQMLEHDPCLMPLEMSDYPPPGCESTCDRRDSFAGCEPCILPEQPLACLVEDPGDPDSLKRCEPYPSY